MFRLIMKLWELRAVLLVEHLQIKLQLFVEHWLLHQHHTLRTQQLERLKFLQLSSIDHQLFVLLVIHLSILDMVQETILRHFHRFRTEHSQKEKSSCHRHRKGPLDLLFILVWITKVISILETRRNHLLLVKKLILIFQFQPLQVKTHQDWVQYLMKLQLKKD